MLISLHITSTTNTTFFPVPNKLKLLSFNGFLLHLCRRRGPQCAGNCEGGREGGTNSADSTLRELPVDPGVAPPTAGLFLLGVSSEGPGEAGRLSAPDRKQSSVGPTGNAGHACRSVPAVTQRARRRRGQRAGTSPSIRARPCLLAVATELRG